MMKIIHEWKEYADNPKISSIYVVTEMQYSPLQKLMLCLSSLLEITALIASLLSRERMQAIISSQEEKQGLN